MSESPRVNALLIGGQTLLIQCGEALRSRGHRIAAVVTSDPGAAGWAAAHEIPVWADDPKLEDRVKELDFDVLFSIVNLKICPDYLLRAPKLAAINFHDGLLPAYAGLNVTNWALINGEAEHGVTWHEMLSEVDRGDIFVQQRFPIVPGETALTLNAKCLEAGQETFIALLEMLEGPGLRRTRQPAEEGRFFAASKKPAALGVVDWAQPARSIERLVNGLDFGTYPNPIASAKTLHDGRVLVLSGVSVLASSSGEAPGTILQGGDAGEVLVATGSEDLRLRSVRLLDGTPAQLTPGVRLASPDAAEVRLFDQLAGRYGRFESFWQQRLARAEALDIDGLGPAGESPVYEERAFTVPPALAEDPRYQERAGQVALACHGLFLARLGKRRKATFPVAPVVTLDSRLYAAAAPLSLAFEPGDTLADVMPRWDRELAGLEKRGSFPLDLLSRQPALQEHCEAWAANRHACVLALSGSGALAAGPALRLVLNPDQRSVAWQFDSRVISAGRIAALQESLAVFIEDLLADTPVAEAGLLAAADIELLTRLNQTALSSGEDCTVHQMFQRQAAATPDAPALACLASEVSYEQLDRRATRWAGYLASQGLRPGQRVGVHLARGEALLPVMLGVLKAGAAYVPLDPDYPEDRVRYMIEDSGAALVISDSGVKVEAQGVRVLLLAEAEAALADAPAVQQPIEMDGSELAYVIYTSGSTGRPKGVMVEHRQLVNFFHGMDQRIERGERNVWLAVTSISFDISVLELFWTLCRGFKVVLQSPSRQAARAAVTRYPDRPMGFSLFFWNYVNEADRDAPDKYRLLMEAARFADSHGFEAVWTPERHFGSFGGSYPNPSVISAALATTTRRIKIRAGSVVMPLHSAIRVAEDWSIVDNLSNGRVGISFASGWQPNDFVIRPEGFDNAKQQMLDGMEQVRRLWRGESVRFEGPRGPVDVATRPSPIQKELPVWITTAGNPDSFRKAGALGANLLTHLLGQTVEQVGENIALYRQAWREAGHPGAGQVTLMLHTLVGEDEETVRETAREPMKNYLKSAMFLVKDAAWEFPTFKKMSQETGKDLDEFFATISDEDMDGLLEFAFDRYYGSSGLFGSVQRCVDMVDRLKEIGVDEIGCLVDYGLANDDVLAHLPNLAVLARAAGESDRPAGEDYDSINEQIERHGVTHLQCTPSQARMLTEDPECHEALQQLRQFMVGGEALPPDLARSLKSLCGGRVTNMYGPTETTIWSTTWEVPADAGQVAIGAPIANTSIAIVDPSLQPLPRGVVGELLIGGHGVVRGYHNRPELTAERFVAADLPGSDQQRWYRTGDLARLDEDGTLLCMGRTDHQVKIRGYRIELGEIENALVQHPQVSAAVALLREDTPGNASLAAYFTTRDGSQVDAAELRTLLAARLPDFMIPAHLLALDHFPQTPNGKIDRGALPAPAGSREDDTGVVAPASGLESSIAGLWCELLERSSVGVTENFFDIGGHSLLAIQVLNKLRGLTDRPVRMIDLFRYPTIKKLADYLQEEGDSSPDSGLDRSQERARARKASRGRRRRAR